MQGLWEGGWAKGLIQKMCCAGSWRADFPSSCSTLAVAHSMCAPWPVGGGQVSVSGRMTKWFCVITSLSLTPL